MKSKSEVFQIFVNISYCYAPTSPQCTAKEKTQSRYRKNETLVLYVLKTIKQRNHRYFLTEMFLSTSRIFPKVPYSLPKVGFI